MFWHYPHYSNQGGIHGSAIREGNYKLIYNYEDESVELYDVVNDIAEKHNIASANMQIVEQLRKKLLKWLKESGTRMPNKNAAYNPSAITDKKKELE